MNYIHIYCGDGKGKTTAAIGLSVRAAGSGMKVLFSQFFKSGTSSEVKTLKSIGSIDYICMDRSFGRYRTMNEAQIAEASKYINKLLDDILTMSDKYDMIVFDEIISTYRYGLIDKEKFLPFLTTDKNKEIILTGREPADELVELADYVSEVKKIKHPYDNGIASREGIEY